jgi:ATP-binding cassette subfamily B protein
VDRGSSSNNRRPNQLRSLSATEHPAIHPALRATIEAGRHHGVELDPNEYRQPPGQNAPSAAALSQWVQNAGVWSRAVRLRWRDLLHIHENGPVVLLLKDGSAALVTGARGADRIVYLTNPEAPPGTPPVAVDGWTLRSRPLTLPPLLQL